MKMISKSMFYRYFYYYYLLLLLTTYYLLLDIASSKTKREQNLFHFSLIIIQSTKQPLYNCVCIIDECYSAAVWFIYFDTRANKAATATTAEATKKFKKVKFNSVEKGTQVN